KLLVTWIVINMRALAVGQKVHGAHLARRSPVIRVFCYSHNLKRARMLQVIAKVLSNGAAIFEILLLKETIHHGDGSRCRRVLFIDGAAFQDFGADGIEIRWAYTHP